MRSRRAGWEEERAEQWLPLAAVVADNEPRVGGIGQVGKEMTHSWALQDGRQTRRVGGAWNKSTFIYQRLKFQFFSNFLPFKCTRSAKWPTRRRSTLAPATDCGTSLLCGGRRCGWWTGLMLGVATLHKLCHELKFFSNSSNNNKNNRRTMPKTTQFFSILFQFFFSSHFAFHIAWRADRGREGVDREIERKREREGERERKSGRVKTTPGYSTFTASSI